MRKIEACFDAIEYSFTDTKREIRALLGGEEVVIVEKKIGGTGLWIVLSDSLEKALGSRYRNCFPMFFGLLLQRLHENKTAMPMRGIRLSDVESAFLEGGERLNLLANQIATGSYQAVVLSKRPKPHS